MRHGKEEAVVWIYKDDRIWSYPKSHGSHEKIWGQDSLHHWRGRFEPTSMRASIIAPVGHDHLPQESLIRKLKEKFGDVTPYSYNPSGKRN